MTDDPGALTGVLLGGRYQLTERIGQGGMAEVYRADDLTLGRVVAVKVLHSQYAADDEFLTRFQQEGRSAARLSHPAIVTVHDVGSAGLAQYIVMELVEGRDLKAVLRDRGRLPLAQALRITSQVLAGLQHAHQRGLIHRDIKPQNILLDAEGNARITDFGIAQAVGGRQLTAASTVIGTAQYCSPEQAMGKPVTPASDVYSVGVVLYELLAGRPPFEADTPVAVALQHVQQEPIPLRQLEPSVPASVETVVMHALAKEPIYRYPTAAAMRDAVQSCLQVATDSTATYAAAVGLDGVSAVGRASAAPPYLPASHRPRRGASRTGSKAGVDWLSIVLGVVVFALAVGAIPLALRVFGSLPDLRPTTSQPSPAPILVPATVTPLRSQPTPIPPTPRAAVPSTVTPRSAAVQPSTVPTVAVVTNPAVVPSLVGLKIDQARQELVKSSLVALVAEEKASATAEAGTVISQSPQAGASVQRNSTVSLVVSKGPDKVAVPTVVGQSVADARTSLEKAGLKVEATDDWSDQVPPGQVSAQRPAAGESVPRDSVVSLTISKGPRPPTPTVQAVRPPEGDWAWVPDVVGLPEAEARRRIDVAGLANTYTNYQSEADVSDKAYFRSISPGSVLSVTPGIGERVQKGSTVKIAVRQQ